MALDQDRWIVAATYAARIALSLDEATLWGSTVIGDLLHAASPPKPAPFAEAERTVAMGALSHAQRNVKAAAAWLGISRATLHRKVCTPQLERHRRRRQS